MCSLQGWVNHDFLKPSRHPAWRAAVATSLLFVGCGSSPNVEQVRSDIPICSQDDYLKDAPRDLAIRDHQNHRGSLAPFWPSPHEVVDCMLNLADVDENDVVVDLGSGDGRIPHDQ